MSFVTLLTITLFQQPEEFTLTLWNNSLNLQLLWYKQNEMIVNLHKFQAVILKNEFKTRVNWVNLNICNENVNINDTVKLLGIEIDKDLTFDTRIAKLCSKAAAPLNGISRLNTSLLRLWCTIREIFKSINNINPKFMKDIFKPKSNDKIRPLDITVNKHRKSLTALNQKKKESITNSNTKQNLYLTI